MHAYTYSAGPQGLRVVSLPDQDWPVHATVRHAKFKKHRKKLLFSTNSRRTVLSSISDDEKTGIGFSASGFSAVMPPPPNIGGKDPKKYWNATALAFLGDSVWELYVRRKFFNPPTRLSSYYKKVVDNVRAESQAEACMLLENSKFLSDEELNILRWGKNATGILPKRFNHGSGSREIYRNATAIECLSGYLYLTSLKRLNEVMMHVGMGDDTIDV